MTSDIDVDLVSSDRMFLRIGNESVPKIIITINDTINFTFKTAVSIFGNFKP